MPDVTEILHRCEVCDGYIPPGAVFMHNIGGVLVQPNGAETPFGGMTFCCTEHAVQWLQNAAPQIPTPAPPYSTTDPYVH